MRARTRRLWFADRHQSAATLAGTSAALSPVMPEDLVSLDDRDLMTVWGGDAAGTAVGAALSRVGSPYVWGATGPNAFDCSGLVQWAYGSAGVHLHRTTSQMIHDGVGVSRSNIQPGDLVFPHGAGHVQMYIGHGQVVEAPHAGASVRVRSLGSAAMIRRVA